MTTQQERLRDRSALAAFTSSQPDYILDLAQVKACTTLSRSTIYRMMERKAFPACLRISSGRIGWRQSAIQKWLAERSSD